MVVQRYLNIALLILYGLSIFSTSSSNMVTKGDIGYSENVRCSGVILKVIEYLGFVMCARECQQTEMCIGFNFGISLLLCELLNSTMKRDEEIGWRCVDDLTWLQERGFSKISHNTAACTSHGKNIPLSSGGMYCQSHGYFPVDCADNETIPGNSQKGVYRIEPGRDIIIDVYCDRGWTVFQRRIDGTVDFYRNWTEYKNGFGDLTGNFWMGNDKFHKMLAANDYKLRIDMEHFSGIYIFAEFSLFKMAGEDQNYRLTVGNYFGNASDAFSIMNNMEFSTLDRDNDNREYSCAGRYFGGWWYNACHLCNLNGKYFDSGSCPFGEGITWLTTDRSDLYFSLKTVVMKVKRLGIQ